MEMADIHQPPLMPLGGATPSNLLALGALAVLINLNKINGCIKLPWTNHEDQHTSTCNKLAWTDHEAEHLNLLGNICIYHNNKNIITADRLLQQDQEVSC